MPSRFTPSPNNISGLTEISGNLYVSGSVSASSYIGAGGSGETNTASNVGSGTGLFKQKSGVDLEFKTLEGSGVTINSYDSVIGLTASGGGSTNPGGSDTQVQFNQNGSFAGDSGLSYDGSGSLSFGSATSDTHQVTGTLTISGSQPLKVFAPQGGGGGPSIVARHTSSIGDWETPVSGALLVSADVWTAGEQNTGAVMYVHSQDEAAIIGFKNSSTLVSGEQKNAVTTTGAKGASIGLVSDDIFLRNHIGDVILRVDGAATNEIVVSGEGTRIGNSVSDVHQVTGTLTVSGNVSASNIVPHDDLTYDLGSTSLQWNKIYANELIGDVEGAIRFDAINDEGDSISKGQVVYIKGVSGQTPTVALAACDDAAKMPAFGLAAADAADGASVQIVTFGSLSNLNLTNLYDHSFSAGDTAFVQTGSGETSGSLTSIAPTGSGNLIQNVGRVIRNGVGGDGQIKVGGAGRSNATPNLDEGYLFVGNGDDQSVQDNTVYVSSSVNRVGINNTTPDHTLTVGGNVKYGTAASDLHQVTGTIAVSGTQPLTIYGPESTDSQASIISTHGTSVPWESPISGGLVVSADNGTGGLGGTGTAVLYVHSKGNYSRLGFKNSSTLVSGEQKNNVTSTSVKGVFVGLKDTELEIRNEIGDVTIRADANSEIVVSSEGTRIGNLTSDRHQFTGSIKISGSTGEAVGLLHVRGDVTASNNVSASAFHGDGSNLTGISAGGSVAGSDSHIQFNQNGSFAGNDKLTYNGTGSLFVSSSISASSFQADFKNLTTTPETMKFQVITASLSSQEDAGGHFEFELADGDLASDTSFSIKQIAGTTFFKVEGDGRTDIDGDVFLASGRKLQSPTVEVTSLLHGEDGGGDATFGLDISATSQLDYDSQDNHINIDFLGTNRFLRFRDNSADDGSQNIIAQIASSSLGGISFDYYTGSISNVSSLNATHITASYVSASTSIQSDLFKNGYYSASISSNTSVPTDQYNFFNYTVGATLSLTASNPVAGASYVFILRQDNTGGRVITFDSDTFKFPSGSAPSMSTGSHEVDILSGISDGVYIYADAAKKFS